MRSIAMLIFLKKTIKISRLILVFLSCLVVSHTSVAIDSIRLSIDQFLFQSEAFLPAEAPLPEKYKEYHIDQLDIILDLSSVPVNLKIDLAKLKLPEPFAILSAMTIVCRSFAIEQYEFSCTKGHISVDGMLETESKTSSDFSFKYHILSDELYLTLDDFKLGDGIISTQVEVINNDWRATIEVKNLEYKFLQHYLVYYMGNSAAKIEEAGVRASFSMQLSGSLSNALSEKTLSSVEFKGYFDKVHYLHGDDIAENLSFNLDFKLQENPKNILLTFMLDRAKGEIYQNEIYLVLTGNERLQGEINYHSLNNSIDFSNLKLILPKILNFQSSGKLVLSDLSENNGVDLIRLNASLDIKDFTQLSQLYLNNIIEGTDYEGLKIAGQFKGHIKKNRQFINLSTELHDLSLAFNEYGEHEQFSFIDLNGKMYWNNYNQKKLPVPGSHLSWQHAALNELPLGQTQFTFITHNDRLKLSKETDIPVFDGALHINSLDIKHIGQSSEYSSTIPAEASLNQSQSQFISSEVSQKPGMTLSIDGMIKPISLEQVSDYFGWPLLDGTISAVIPATIYNENLLQVGGAMMLQVFDGVVIIKDLTIEQPLQGSARLTTNIDLNNLNLESLTKTYNFGKIQGRVEGKFTDVVLQSWQPVAFDAYIRTPEGDKSRHRISQRAIDNLSSLGGASGLLSRTFLSFFETFGYDKIGISCKLKNNICTMAGVESKGNSYYIVKGGGIPRIDVMGFQNQVNWQVLINRLKAIQSANEAVIQ